jgi:ABC-type nitrate/sulfonate/bicarbonate transport system ATPase subunit
VATSSVRFERVSKRFGTVAALQDLDLAIEPGEFVSLLGPSGSGKTTTLNLLAGLLPLDQGRISIGERDVSHLPPDRRDIAMVFQSYALYPHMTVFENLAFPLLARRPKPAPAAIEAKVGAVAETLGVGELLARYPRELSGGQQQRVALGRGMVRDPRVFLLDEPLSNLDVTPREALSLNVDDITDQFAAGRYAMAISSSLRMSGLQRTATFNKDDIGILPWPSGTADGAAPMPVSGWWIAAWARSPRLADAVRFVDFMQGREGARLWAVVGGQVPTRRSLLQDPFFAAPEQAWVRTMVDAWGRRSWMEPTDCNTRTMQAILNEAVHRVVVQNAEPMAALREAERRFQEAQ